MILREEFHFLRQFHWGFRHVMAMFIGNLTPLIIVMGVCGLTADAGFGELRTALLQNAMIIAGVVTLVQMFSIGPVGGKVPIVMGNVIRISRSSEQYRGSMRRRYFAAYGAIIGSLYCRRYFRECSRSILKPLRKFSRRSLPDRLLLQSDYHCLRWYQLFLRRKRQSGLWFTSESVSGFVVLVVIVLLETFRTAEKYPFFVCNPVWVFWQDMLWRSL